MTILQICEAKKKVLWKLYVTGFVSLSGTKWSGERNFLSRCIFGTRDWPAILKKFKADYKHEWWAKGIERTPHTMPYMKIFLKVAIDLAPSVRFLWCGASYLPTNWWTREKSGSKSSWRHKELLLIAQDSTLGWNIYKKEKSSRSFFETFRCGGIDWIRLALCLPTGPFPRMWIRGDEERPNILQILGYSIATRIKRCAQGDAKRNNSAKSRKSLIIAIRDIYRKSQSVRPYDCRTSGEGEKDISGDGRSCRADWSFERLGVFRYSHEEKYACLRRGKICYLRRKSKAEQRSLDGSSRADFHMIEISRKSGRRCKVLIDKKERWTISVADRIWLGGGGQWSADRCCKNIIAEWEICDCSDNRMPRSLICMGEVVVNECWFTASTEVARTGNLFSCNWSLKKVLIWNLLFSNV